jgi:hypothetical protein
MTEADHAGLWSTQKPLSKQISTSLIRRIAKKSRIIAGEWGRRGNSSVTYAIVAALNLSKRYWRIYMFY